MFSALFAEGYGPFRRALALFVIVGILPLRHVSAQNRPANRETAEQHYNRGLTHYEKKDYPNAIREFQAAYKIRQLPRILLNIGQVYRKLGMASTALRFYEHYLRVEPKPKPEIKQEVDRYIAMTRAMLDPPPFESIDSSQAKAAAAAEVAAARSNVTATVVKATDPMDLDASAKPTDGKADTTKTKKTGLEKPTIETPTADATTPPANSTTPTANITAPGTGSAALLKEPSSLALIPNANPETPPPTKPFFKQPLFWGIAGGLAAAVIITGIAVGVSQHNRIPPTVLYPTR